MKKMGCCCLLMVPVACCSCCWRVPMMMSLGSSWRSAP
jgi:hypothetical protein